MPEPKKRKLTLKQTKFIKEYISNGGNATQAVKDSYPGHTSYEAIRAMGSENLSKPHISQEIRAILDKQGLTLEGICEELGELVKNGDASTKTKNIRTALEVLGAMNKNNITVNTGVVSLDIDKIRQALTV